MLSRSISALRLARQIGKGRGTYGGGARGGSGDAAGARRSRRGGGVGRVGSRRQGCAFQSRHEISPWSFPPAQPYRFERTASSRSVDARDRRRSARSRRVGRAGGRRSSGRDAGSAGGSGAALASLGSGGLGVGQVGAGAVVLDAVEGLGGSVCGWGKGPAEGRYQFW